MRRASVLLGFLLFGLASGCEGVIEEEIPTADFDLVSENRLTMNRLTMNRLTMNRLTMNGLMDPATGEAAAELVKYSARCMLTQDQRIGDEDGEDGEFVDSSGAPQQFVGDDGEPGYPGLLGLEPGWYDQALTDVGRRWWAGCLAAHATSLDTPVATQISVRSDMHPALAASKTEARTFSYQQGAFWAAYDATKPEGEEFSFYSCRGTAFDYGRAGRFCLFEDHSCGSLINYVGFCEKWISVTSAACASKPDGNVDGCHPGVSASPSWASSAREVITVYMK